MAGPARVDDEVDKPLKDPINDPTYVRLEILTRKWWFYVLLFLVPALVPNLSAKGPVPLREVVDFGFEIAGPLEARKWAIEPLMPYFHIAQAILILALLVWGNKMGKIFSTLVGIHFLFVAQFQTVAVTERYGVAVIAIAFIWFALIGLGWIWEARLGRTDYTLRRLPWRSYWVVPMAIFAFWDPDVPWTFDPSMFLNSTSPTAFCMIVTIYLAIVLLYFPHVNLPLLRVSSFVAIVMTVFIAYSANVRGGSDGLYWLLLHSPMTAVGLYGLIRALRPPAQAADIGQPRTAPQASFTG